MVLLRRHLVAGAPDEHVGDVADAPPLLQARDARQHFPRDDRRVGNRVELFQTPVAGAAVMRFERLAEILDQRSVPAARAAGIAFHVAQQRADRLGQFAARLEQLPPAQEIAVRIDQHAFRRQAITAGAARLLLVVLGRTRRAGMDHETDVRAIDPHPERDGGDDDVDLFVRETPPDGGRAPRPAGRRDTAPPAIPRPSASRPSLPPRGVTGSR